MTIEIENNDGVLLHDGQCLGYLMHFPGKGTYDPDLGRVEVSKEDADRHNRLLDQMLVEGLRNCRIGQGYHFYLTEQDGKRVVTTWAGSVVDPAPVLKGTSVTFRKFDHTFRGRLSKEDQVFNFKRIA